MSGDGHSPQRSPSISTADTEAAKPNVPSGRPAATRETDDFPEGGTYDGGDVADDSAIWADPAKPASSVVFSDNKDTSVGGIAVFDMDGSLLQFRQDGRIGNVDVRDGFELEGRSVVLVGATNRSDDTLIFWEYDPVSRLLEPPNTARTIDTQSDNYGFCMYRSPVSGTYYAFVTSSGDGQVEQYELFDNAGEVDATKVRTFDVGGQTEGCVADDELGDVYFGEEDEAVWKYDAEPGAGTDRVAVDRVGGHVEADVEGMAIVYGENGTGYLIVSSQGNSRLAVYKRAGENAFVGDFTVSGAGTVDPVSETDGVDVSAADLGPGFEHGALVVHDHENSGGTTSNLKYVPLEEVVTLTAP